MLPFQRRIAAAHFGQEREAVISIAKGNAKSSLAALIAVHHLLTTPRPLVLVGAASRDQARTLYAMAKVWNRAFWRPTPAFSVTPLEGVSA